MAKTAFISGMDGSAIAVGIADSLLESGYEIVATSEGKYDAGEEARQEFDRTHERFPSVQFEKADFSSEEGVENLITRLCARTFDVVINCASTIALTEDGGLRDESVAFSFSEFGRVMQYNVTALAAVCFGLRNNINKGGSVINVTSGAAQEGAFATFAYNASKAAVDNLTKSFANTLGPSKGIRVNSIAPGWVPPNPDAAGQGIIALGNALTPSQVMGTPGDVAKAVQFLIDAPFQNGSVLPVDGGISSSYLPYLLESLELQGLPVNQVIDDLVQLVGKAKSDMAKS
jgi:NAD(P)-dependent dehydrogenase (short-subunit alcohol dehydrogenase family)